MLWIPGSVNLDHALSSLLFRSYFVPDPSLLGF